ncbi:MAG: DUF4397 domain-containing protein [Lachnospiraceae bacterium]|nr:DUF4397 domain-containing protein [Lachnospiraceae bacterium]
MEQGVLFSRVRVLHAACFAPAVGVVIGNREVVKELRYGEASGYARITGGFRRVTVVSRETGEELLSETVPFPEGSQLTLVICNTMNQLSLIPMPETVCDAGKGKGCFRVANYTFDDGPFRVLQDRDTVFACVAPGACTSFLPAAAGSYDFWLAETEDCAAMAEPAYGGTGTQSMRRPESGDAQVSNSANRMPLPESAGEIYVRVMPGVSYTACILGACGSDVPLEIKILEF